MTPNSIIDSNALVFSGLLFFTIFILYLIVEIAKKR